MSEHTPGPWAATAYPKSIVIAPNGSEQIPMSAEGLRYYGGPLVAESVSRRADVYLIAAAPSLLSALEAVEWSRVVDMHGGQHDAYQCPTCWGDKHDGHTDCSLHAALKLARGEK